MPKKFSSTKTVDLKGKRFGTHTARRLANKQNGEGRLWLCQCDCGREKTVLAAHLNAGMVKSCGHGPCRGGGIQVDLRGEKFGALKVLCDSSKRTAADKRLWKCECKTCGRRS